MHYKLIFIAILSITLYACHVDAIDKEYCSVDDAREMVYDACSYLVERVKKRETNLGRSRYKVELVKARYHHHRHPYAKKITHPDFPKGGYILVHYPHARHFVSSYSNEIVENNMNDNYGSDILTNDIHANDINTSPEHRPNQEHRQRSIKNNHILRFQRNAGASPTPVDFCCQNEDKCHQYHCH